MRQIIRILLRHGFYSKGGSNMNLTELQIQLREIEEHISTLQGEIEKMKPQPEEEKKKVYETITKIALKYPLENRKFSQAVLGLNKVYISCLAYITLADEKNLDEKLLYLCRLAHSMKCFTSAEDILRMGLEVNKEYFEKACYELKGVKDFFLVDALIVTNISEEASYDALVLIADVAQIMECGKEELQVISLLAKSVLTNDFNNLLYIPVPKTVSEIRRFKEQIPPAWIESQRVYIGKICTDVKRIEQDNNDSSSTASFLKSMRKIFNFFTVEPCKITTRQQAGSIVEKGQAVITYHKKMTEDEIKKEAEKDEKLMQQYLQGESIIRYKEVSMIAPSDGLLFLVENEERDTKNGELRKYVVAYVVSYFDDYTEFCKQYKK